MFRSAKKMSLQKFDPHIKKIFTNLKLLKLGKYNSNFLYSHDVLQTF